MTLPTIADDQTVEGGGEGTSRVGKSVEAVNLYGMDIIVQLLQKPITIGLLIGLIVASAVWLRYVSRLNAAKKAHRAEVQQLHSKVARLEMHIRTQMELNADGNNAVKEELEALKKQNENLRTTNSSLSTKPGRAELRQLHLYEKALSVMHVRAPGFSVAWSEAIKDAEAELEKEGRGLMKWIRKPFQLGKPPASEQATGLDNT